MSVKIVVPGDMPSQIQGSPHLERLKTYGEVVVYTTRPADEAEQLARASGATCIINSRGAVKWPGARLEQLPALKMITVCGIGTDPIDLVAAKKRGVVVTNIPSKTAPIVAEHAFALMLAVAKRTAAQTAAMKRGEWSGTLNQSLRKKTLGLVGTGNIGAEVARLARVLDMRVLAWTFNPSDERAKELGVTFVPLPQLLAESDVVSVHVKLTDDTRGLLGATQLGLMKRGALLVNTARGAVVDSVALVAALKSGALGGAGIDVFEQEPLPKDHPLLSCEEVVLTPHNADQTPEGMDILNEWCVNNVIAFLEGKPVNRVA